MIAKLLHRLTANRPMRLIEIQGEPYLERYHIASLFGRSIWLHHFVRNDEERHVHDHPWSALSIVLTGAYLEEIQHYSTTKLGQGYSLFTFKNRKALGFNWIPATKRHRIASVIPGTWSLMLVGKRHGNGWHFYQGQKKYQPFASTGDDWHKTAGTRSDVYLERLTQNVIKDIIYGQSSERNEEGV